MEFSQQVSSSIDQVIQSVPLIKVELVMALGFLMSIAGTLFFDKIWKHSSFYICLVSILGAFLVLFSQQSSTEQGFFGMLSLGKISYFGRMLIMFSLFISSIFIQQHFEHKTFKKRKGDIYSILLAAGIGMNFLTMTEHWLMVFIAIEMISISSYILVGYFSENKAQSEASMKYALFGSACSAVMLYGLSLIYGLTGNLNFLSPQHMQGLTAAPEIMVSISLLFIFTGIGFKLSFIPFHLWAPDVYEGAPTPVTAFLSTVPKIAVLIFFAKLASTWLSSPFYFGELTFLFLGIVSMVTMLAGNLIALRQTDIKRMMAYSSIGHTGFLLMAIIGYSHEHMDILLFYLLAYTIMNLAFFAFIDVLEQKLGSTAMSAYAGLGKQLPILFTCFSFVGISLIGIPPTAGFVAKLLVFSSIFEQYQILNEPMYLGLLIVGALTSVISLFYYFKVPLQAFLRNNAEVQVQDAPSSKAMLYIGIILTIMLLVFGIFPSLVLDFFTS